MMVFLSLQQGTVADCAKNRTADCFRKLQHMLVFVASFALFSILIRSLVLIYMSILAILSMVLCRKLTLMKSIIQM